jgi:flagellar biogenesis protein FliO
MTFDKKHLLLIVAAVCIVLYFYGSQIKKDNQCFQALPILGGLAFGLNTLIQLVQVQEPKDRKSFITNDQSTDHKPTH